MDDREVKAIGSCHARHSTEKLLASDLAEARNSRSSCGLVTLGRLCRRPERASKALRLHTVPKQEFPVPLVWLCTWLGTARRPGIRIRLLEVVRPVKEAEGDPASASEPSLPGQRVQWSGLKGGVPRRPLFPGHRLHFSPSPGPTFQDRQEVPASRGAAPLARALVLCAVARWVA